MTSTRRDPSDPSDPAGDAGRPGRAPGLQSRRRPGEGTEPPQPERAEPGPAEAEASCQKIAFVGSHGVGKTTLCFELAARLKRLDQRVDMVREVARRCPLPLNRSTTLEAQAWILHTQIANEIELGLRNDWLVCDRGVVDNYAYMVDRLGRQTAFDPLVKHWMTTYSHIIWVPVLDQPRYDGVRDTDRRFQLRIEETLAQLLKAFDTPTMRLHHLDRDDWIDHIIENLGVQTLQLPLFEEDL